jgi:hypothetical protein
MLFVNSSPFFRQLAAALLVTVMLGCGSGAPKVNTVPVSGTVTLDGKPLKQAVVKFYDVTGKNNPSSGTTDDNGKFSLGFASYKGAIPGSYKVTVEYFTDMEGKEIVPKEGTDATMLVMEGKAKQSLHGNYSEYTTTTLKQDVKSGETNNFTFALKADGS